MTTTEAEPWEIRATGRTAGASPLRYPGGKAALRGSLAGSLPRLNIEPATYVEPYAGGAGAGVALLRQDAVQHSGDQRCRSCRLLLLPALSWSIRRGQFAARVVETPLNVEEWRRQKEIPRSADESDPFALGFAFFYLNRTNRSGILKAAARFGGVRQNGNYKIDARFNRDQLAERIAAIGNLKSRITVMGTDGMSVMQTYCADTSAFVYVDPPYVDMGGSLYLNAFTHRDHADLAREAGSASRRQLDSYL